MYRQFLGFGGEVSKTAVQRVSDGVFVPFDSNNSDYVEYLNWLSEGNTPLPPETIKEAK